MAAGAHILKDPSWRAAPETAPRLVAPPRELAAAEETVIALFEATKPSVVAIATANRSRSASTTWHGRRNRLLGRHVENDCR